jgi:hypothetical protein
MVMAASYHSLLLLLFTHHTSFAANARHTGVVEQQQQQDEAAVFSLSQTLPQLLPSSLLSPDPGSLLDLSVNGLVALMDAGEVGWRGEGVLPAWVRIVEGARGTEALKIEVVVEGSAE